MTDTEIQNPIPATLSLAELPAARESLIDGRFAGVTTLADGKHYVVIWLDQAKPPKRQSKDAQMEWAKSIGAQLITRAIGSMLVAVFGADLPQEWVWTSEDYEHDPSSYAWVCNLDNGDVYSYDRSASGGGVAVRLIPLVP